HRRPGVVPLQHVVGVDLLLRLVGADRPEAEGGGLLERVAPLPERSRDAEGGLGRGHHLGDDRLALRAGGGLRRRGLPLGVEEFLERGLLVGHGAGSGFCRAHAGLGARGVGADRVAWSLGGRRVPRFALRAGRGVGGRYRVAAQGAEVGHLGVDRRRPEHAQAQPPGLALWRVPRHNDGPLARLQPVPAPVTRRPGRRAGGRRLRPDRLRRVRLLAAHLFTGRPTTRTSRGTPAWQWTSRLTLPLSDSRSAASSSARAIRPRASTARARAAARSTLGRSLIAGPAPPPAPRRWAARRACRVPPPAGPRRGPAPSRRSRRPP